MKHYSDNLRIQQFFNTAYKLDVNTDRRFVSSAIREFELIRKYAKLIGEDNPIFRVRMHDLANHLQRVLLAQWQRDMEHEDIGEIEIRGI